MKDGLQFHTCSNDTKKINGLKQFDCGEPIINSYLKNNYLSHIQNSSRAGGILLDGTNSNTIVAFYAISTVTINSRDFENSFSKKFPNNIPVLKIWMVGVDKNYQSQGIGTRLLGTIFIKAIESAKNTGCVGIVLDAVVNRISFYQALGFKQLEDTKPDGSLPMFISLAEISAATAQR